MFVKNGTKSGIVAGYKVIKTCRSISYKTRLADVRDKVVDFNRVYATEEAVNGWLFWGW